MISRNLVNAIAEGLQDPGIGQKLRQLREEESQLADQILTCQLEADQAVELNVAVVREHVQNVRDLVQAAGPGELKILLQDFFRLSLNLQNKEGQLSFRLAPESPGEAFPPRTKTNRSARTTICPSVWIAMPDVQDFSSPLAAARHGGAAKLAQHPRR